MNSERLIAAQNNPDYWTDIKYYLRQDLHDAWEDNDRAYLEWAAACAQTVPRVKHLLNSLMQDLKFLTPETIFRHLDFCRTHNLEIDRAVLGHATAFGMDVVQGVVQRLSTTILNDNSTISVYYAVLNGNHEALEYFDTLFDLRDIAGKLRHCDMTDTAATVDMYVTKRSLSEHTREYGCDVRAKKM